MDSSFSVPAACIAAVSEVDSSSPDGMLVAAALAGEQDAFALLVDRYQGPLLRAATSRLGRRELAEEAVQETFLCAHRWLTTYDSRFSFRTWLWTIALNQCARQAKREAKLPRAAVFNETEHGLRDSVFGSANHRHPLQDLLARETADKLHELLARLPEAQADALRLRFFGGLTFSEIAAAMGCSEPGAKHRVKTGLMRLAEWMSDARAPEETLLLVKRSDGGGRT
jgi:RNA polymerase sigma-70 factor (ECF subfamily)